MDETEEEIKKVQKELDDITDTDKPKAIQKRAVLERRMAEISVERDEIRSLEENLFNIDHTYKRLLETHQEELIQKEIDLKSRLIAFKKEVERRDREKERLKAREEYLQKKEKELDSRIGSLKGREKSLKKVEEEMKKTISALEEEKDALADVKRQAENIITGEGMWMIQEDELKKVVTKSKKLRLEWINSQEEMQKELKSGKTAEDIERDLEEEFARKEEELTVRIGELEETLKNVESQEVAISEEEKKLIDLHDDIKKVLKDVDDLLGHLPDDKIEKFAKSKKFKTYEKVMDELGL